MRRQIDLKICCILNEKSGVRKTAGAKDIVELFANCGISIKILIPNESKSISDLANQVAQQNYDVVVAAGGDGTINAVASALVGHTSTRLGILPLGTLNHFARDLGIPFDTPAAVEIICAGYSEAKDVGAVNELYFVNNASVGLYPAIVKIRESLQSTGYSKKWAALISSFRALRSFRRFELDIQPTNGTPLKIKTAMLFVGNNAYEIVGTSMGKRLAIDLGLLWVTTPTSSSRTELFFNVLAMVSGYEKPANTLTLEVTSLKVSSKKSLLKVATDGEVSHLKTPLNFRIFPKALNVIVPAPQSHK